MEQLYVLYMGILSALPPLLMGLAAGLIVSIYKKVAFFRSH